jgi:hypothetical protein
MWVEGRLRVVQRGVASQGRDAAAYFRSLEAPFCLVFLSDVLERK